MLFSCFVSLLVVAAVLWKVKIRVDRYRRRQRMFVEMAQMASRPFGSIQLELSGPGLLNKVGCCQCTEICRLVNPG